MRATSGHLAGGVWRRRRSLNFVSVAHRFSLRGRAGRDGSRGGPLVDGAVAVVVTGVRDELVAWDCAVAGGASVFDVPACREQPTRCWRSSVTMVRYVVVMAAG